ncbi:hypothetical protein [Rahnella contaminans]|jgi:hypothetical protein|uniref:hypothetical protein n=1 Tax=Rahnella contaminans TaxID=2703882 RepID=UPI000DE84A23|nr:MULTISPECIES: hypothetical protein [Rahnella]MDF1896678.1 hypothetical protein [Rahnella contaminans]RBQ33757.1 hypothetical protein C2125_13965 [Rahnella aquatilis]
MVINPGFPKEWIFFSDVKDAVAYAATGIFLTGYEICHDTLVECLAERLAYANIVEDSYTAAVMQQAINLLEEHRGHR